MELIGMNETLQTIFPQGMSSDKNLYKLAQICVRLEKEEMRIPENKFVHGLHKFVHVCKMDTFYFCQHFICCF